MYQEERLVAIMRYLKEHQRMSVQEICERFGVSRDTARRDLVKLSEQNAIIRTRGGAVLPVVQKEIESYKERLDLKSEVKSRIGAEAARHIKQGDLVLMDTSTTVQHAAQALQAEEVTVVTNSIDIADILSTKERVTVHLLGGVFHAHSRYLYGVGTVKKLQEYHVDKCFMGGGGVAEDGIYFPSEDDGQVVRQMIAQAEQVIVLVDRTKFNKKLFFKVCALEQIDVLIADDVPEEWQERLAQAEVEVIRVMPGVRS
ncbi:DeoR/GlpR transcriptional regulator [Laceyella sacchari]|jgi:DeoR/GlpR family transcriptional regulator of sugar metabolism|uniref:Transcriptional regulator, DeoR family n=1 Tax=Laceyella tengchongensis TaxID=574699 RepID=A0AA46AD70_9BACL|nr:DeoR/GlpR family DNA-binding transcription regulator [Laceyella tengchongensis]AUS08128.1 DeoR/GlpR transcriptional regulator [Laceyella sacchari]SMP02951.1 transcriptional regulator, DeoR family [Laceyella tengchongensis]